MHGFVEDPQIQLVRNNTDTIATNGDWEGDLNAAAPQAVLDAWGITLHPLDAALVLELSPGLYTVIVTGTNGGTGIIRVGTSDVEAIVGSTTAHP